jgi:hypothetical protein
VLGAGEAAQRGIASFVRADDGLRSAARLPTAAESSTIAARAAEIDLQGWHAGRAIGAAGTPQPHRAETTDETSAVRVSGPAGLPWGHWPHTPPASPAVRASLRSERTERLRRASRWGA